MATVPEEPYVLDIISATYGDIDYTAYVRSQSSAFQKVNPTARSWTFTTGNTWFNNDPLPGYWKTTIVVWRNTIQLPNGDVVWSDCKRLGVVENETLTVTFDGKGDIPWSAPSLPSNGRYIVSAFWFNKDCTNIAQNICSTQFFDPSHYHGLQFDVGVATLGPDPWIPTGKKQFSITYGSPSSTGGWDFSCKVASGPNTGWTLELPLLFPPLNQPNTDGNYTYLTFRNEAVDFDIYPIIYNLDRTIAWDGRAANFLVPIGTTKDVDLIGRASLKEFNYYYCGYISRDGSQVYGCGTETFIASTSGMARPCTVYIRKLYGYLIACGTDYMAVNKPIGYQARDLRLNIYSVTWGATDYTDFVRQKYISQTITTPPSDTINSWSFNPTSDESVKPSYFGPDPFGGRQKACVVIYRVAYRIGQTDGFINGPTDPAPWDPAYKTLQSLHTDQYPVLRNITGFRIVTARIGSTMQFDLLKEQLNQPLTLPSPCPSPYVAAAVWSTRDVTAYATNIVKAAPANAAITLAVGSAGMGQGYNPADPWWGVNKQCTVLVGYPSTPGDGNTLRWRTIVGWGGPDPWYLTISRQYSSTAPTAMPAGFVSDQQTKPTITAVNLTNLTSGDAWPQVVSEAGQVVWDGRTAGGGGDRWKIPRGQTKSLVLTQDAKCIEGMSYGVNFYYSQWTFPPFCGWMVASSNDWWKVDLTYMPAPTKDRPQGYQILREIRYGGP